MLRKLTAALLALFLMLAAVPGLAEETAAETNDGEFPQLNEAGFLDEGEFVYIDAEAGVWRYASQTLRVEILRHQYTDPPRQVWYEAEIWSDVAAGELLDVLPWNESKRMTDLQYPYKVAREHGTVFAISADFAHLRISRRMGTGVGIIIRDGKVISSKTHKRTKKGFPNLDTLALLPDGSMFTSVCDEYTAAEYLEMGATDVLAFGPWMIHEGELNPNLGKATSEHAQRTAIGMVAPGHYWAMVMDGRTKVAKGANCEFLAERMLEHGCVEAFNLDGGQSSSMVFMGRQINIIYNEKGRKASGRRAAEIIGIGTSASVPDVDSKEPMSY